MREFSGGLLLEDLEIVVCVRERGVHECVVDAFGGAQRGMCVYYVFEAGMDRGADGGAWER